MVELDVDLVPLRWRLCFLPEEKFAQAVCFLLVDLYLLTFQPEKALHLLAVLDKLSAQGSSKNSKGEVLHSHSENFFCFVHGTIPYLVYMSTDLFISHAALNSSLTKN